MAQGRGATAHAPNHDNKDDGDHNRKYFFLHPVILQSPYIKDEMAEERAKLFDGVYYVDLNTVHKYFNQRFYEDKGYSRLFLHRHYQF